MTRAELIAAVLADPGVLWDLATRDLRFRVAGPWEKLYGDALGWKKQRLYASGGVACKAAPVEDGWQGRWAEGAEWFPTEAEALAWCDARLREVGVLLVEDE